MDFAAIRREIRDAIMRFGAFFVGLCMVIVAASVGAATYLALELPAVTAAACGVTTLSLLTAYNAFAGRARDRADVARRITDLSRGVAELARQVGDQGRRIVAAEAALTQIGERSRAATEPLDAEMDMLGTLVKQLAESVAAHDTILASGGVVQPPAAHAAHAEAFRGVAPPVLPPEPRLIPMPAQDTAPAALATAPVSPPLVETIRSALDANRLELFLQPIVTLPQRKVRFYEALSRLRTEDGGLLLPADYLHPADMAGLLPQLDNLMLFRAVQVARRLTARSRDGGVFCNLANATLVDSRVFSQVYDFLSANRALAPALIFEFGQAALRAMGPIEQESLSQIADLGFRFSMDQVSDLHFEPRALAEQGFRFVKAPAALLLASPVATTAEIHTSDFANLLGRFGIELIADRIETEAAVIDLLDYDLRFAQGQLFAPPRPVRGDVFQSAAVPLPETPHPPAPRAPAPPVTTAPTGAAPPAAPPLSGLRALARPVAAPVARTTGRPDAMAGAADAAPQNMPERDLSGLVALARAFGRKV